MAFLAGAGLAFIGGLGAGKLVLDRIGNLQAQQGPTDNEEDCQVGTSDQPLVVFVLGGPGSGKGTNCERIVKDLGFIHLSAGDLLRQERKSGSRVGDMIEEYVREGKIVPSEVTVGLLKKAMAEKAGTKFLIDGFPRNQENLDCWNRNVTECEVACVLVLECSEEVMEERLLQRGQTSGRSDDNVAAIRKRFETHREATVPIVDFFEGQGKVRRVDSGRDREAVYTDVRAVIAGITQGSVAEPIPAADGKGPSAKGGNEQGSLSGAGPDAAEADS